MAESEERGNTYEGDQDYTRDGTVDLRGRPVLRSRTGRWKACFFIIGYEMVERLAFVAIQVNLVLYLTRELHQGTVTSSDNVTNWLGTASITPILGAYVADAYLGCYWTFIISSTIFLLGMVLLTLAVTVPALKPPQCTLAALKENNCPKASSFQLGIFYLALYVIAVGSGGTKPNMATMGADQFDDFEPKEKKQKLSFFNWWLSSMVAPGFFAATFLVYLQDNVGWTIGYGLPTAGVLIFILVFFMGTPFYRHKRPLGSPFTRMAKVFLAALGKWNVPLPDDPRELYELSLEEYTNNGKQRTEHTPLLRFLDKAAVNTGTSSSPWMLCPVTQVEATKQIMKMIPILITSIIPNTMIAQVVTLFIKQGTTLDRSIGPHFKIPPASLTAFVSIFMVVSTVIYDRLVVPILRRHTKNPRGISLLQRLGLGIFLHIIVMIIASLLEKKRLSIAKEHGVLSKGDTVPLSIFILLPQFALMGVADSFLEASQMEFFYDQAPEGMKSLGSSFFSISRGIGFFLGTFILTTVSDITKMSGHRGWVLDNLNVSRLDHYYAFLAALAFINFLCFIVVSKLFVYNAEVKMSQSTDFAPETLPNEVV